MSEDGGLVVHRHTEIPEEVRAFWTPERIAGAKSAMPEVVAPQAEAARPPMYDKFLARLKEIREYEWTACDLKIAGEIGPQKGVRPGESALEAIARHMAEVLAEQG